MIKGRPFYQSEKVPVEPAIIVAIEKYLDTHDLGNRGVEDGDKRKQFVGLLGELLVIQNLTGQPVNLEVRQDGFDGGYDFVYKGHRIDVKTMERKSFVRGDFVNNFYIMQEAYEADVVVFCSYHAPKNILEICGWIYKKNLGTLGKFYKAGTKRVRADGSSFIFRQDNYEVENKDLIHIREL